MIRAARSAPAALEQERFCVWVLPHWDTMRRVAARIGANGEADDVLQNAVLAAWRHRARFDESRGSARVWLTTITVNEARKSHRGRGRTVALRDDDSAGGTEPVLVATLDLARAIAALPERQALAVQLHYYADLSVRDTAAVMGCAEGTVKSTLSTARATLRTLLKEEFT